MISDTQELRDLLIYLLPGIQIDGVPRASGQRVVYYSTHHVTGESVDGVPEGRVVLKVAKSSDPTQITRLQREIDILNELNLDCFPKLYHNDLFSQDPRTEDPIEPKLFVTLEEFIDSHPLQAVRANYANPCQVLELLHQLVEALSHLWLHRNRIVHRDLKPDNILIRPEGRVVIIDLGIARHEGESGQTQTGMIGPHTPAYSSPEQFDAHARRSISYKADFFCIGIIAYELLTGLHPFRSTVNPPDPFATIHNVRNLVPPTPAQVSAVPIGVSNLVMEMLEKRPHQRPRTPAALQERIRDLIVEECQ